MEQRELVISLRTDSDTDGLDDGADKRSDVVHSHGVGALDELETETEADDGLMAEQCDEQREHAGHTALQTNRDAFEEVME